MYCPVFSDAIEATNGPVSSGIGCRGVDYSTSSSEVLVHAIALEYNGLRQDDALAAVDLTYAGIGGKKVRGRAHSPLMFKVQVMIFMILHKLTFGLVPLPAILRVMKGDTARYSTLKQANEMEKYVAYGTVIGILGVLLSKLM